MAEDKKVTDENIRYTLRFMDYDGRVDTETGFNNGLKLEDPVVIIHRDDFMNLIDQPRDSGIWLKFNRVYKVMSKW